MFFKADLYAVDINKKAGILLNKAVSLGILGRFDDAESCISDAFEIEQESIDAQTTRAQLYWYEGKFKESLYTYDQVVDEQGNNILIEFIILPLVSLQKQIVSLISVFCVWYRHHMQ